ncbi:MAG TPA: hypothetical protein DCS07_07220 [Bdellovibrionales bacterium]|nr:MAG: hypothetical protein A2X97_00775 [Bdellovibrionales bacterium GWA1_52_35]OFZ34935.1 MAG: hypothetical protein A2070_14445 [Bdellovibrionales bacterium GWC1_52_8]HAR42409.1 hypothetical protein [Bdellovibrionales bacterium]HCM40666.1 hypothetical protein [Bdellovibrionales bacterium]
MKKYVMMSLLAFAFSFSAFAAETVNRTPVDIQDEAYFTIGAVTIEEVTDGSEPVVVGPQYSDQSIIAGSITIDEIVNYGKQIWQVILNNKPVVNLTLDNANGLPQGVRYWTGLSNWQTPFSKTYRVNYQNLYGMSVVDFSFRVIFTYGGKLDGKGLYIANAAIAPANLDVAWGYTFNAKAAASTILNTGTTRAPVAGIQMDVHWSIDTIVKHTEGAENFFMRGDGFFQQMK